MFSVRMPQTAYLTPTEPTSGFSPGSVPGVRFDPTSESPACSPDDVVPDADPPRLDARIVESAPVFERRRRVGLAGQRLHIPPELAEPRPLEGSLADAEPFADEVVERDPSSRHVSSVPTGLERDAVVLGGSLQGFGIDERDVTRVGVLGFVVDALPVAIPITLDAAAGDGLERLPRLRIAARPRSN